MTTPALPNHDLSLNFIYKGPPGEPGEQGRPGRLGDMVISYSATLSFLLGKHNF